jgi:hypothetical protein
MYNLAVSSEVFSKTPRCRYAASGGELDLREIKTGEQSG